MRTPDTRRRWWACWGRLHCLPNRHRMDGGAAPSLHSSTTPVHPPPPPSPAAAAEPLSPAHHHHHHQPPQPSSPAPSSAADSFWAAVPPSSPASIPYTDATPSPTAVLTLFPIRAPTGDCPSSPSVGGAAALLEPQRLLRPIFFDSVLVTPPLASTLTTEPTTPLSTAPFTPPPELAHLTTPPSPEVPFAQLLSPPRGVKSGPLPTLELVYRLCPGSPSAEAHSPSAAVSSSPPPPHPFSLFAASGGGDSLPRLRAAQDLSCQARQSPSQDVEEPTQEWRRQQPQHSSPAEILPPEEDPADGAGSGEGGDSGFKGSSGAQIVARSPVRALERFVETVLKSEAQGSSCAECDALNSKCHALSEALLQTKEKLNGMKQQKESGGGDREQKFKQIIHWMQIEAKSQAESIFRLSEELSWQETAFLDMQEQRLADLGVDLHGVNRELSSTEVS